MKRIFFLTLLVLMIGFVQANAKIDSLEIKLEKATGKERIILLNKISSELWDIDPKKSIKYSNESLSLIPEYGDSLDKAYVNQNLGTGYWMLGKYDEAEIYYLKAKDLFLLTENMKHLAGIYSNLAMVYNYKNQLDKAIEYQLKGLEIEEENNYREGMISTTNNLGLIYATQENYEEAHGYFIRSLELQKELKKTDHITYSLNNIGVMYLHLEMFDKASEYFKESLGIAKENKNAFGIAFSLFNIAKVDVHQGKLEEALAKVNESLEIRRQFGDPRNITENLLLLTEILIDKDDLDKALPYLQEAIDLCRNNGLIQQRVYLEENFSLYYEKKGMYKEALEKYKVLTALKDSIFTEENAKQINEFKTKFNVGKKERENEILRKNNEIQALQLEKNKLIQNYYKILLLIGLLFMFVIFMNLKNKNKANKQLQEKNELISKRDEELLIANDKLKELIENKDKFISIMAHDIKNPLVAQISGTRILIKEIEKLDDKNLLVIAQEMQRNIVHLISLLDNLLKWSRLQNGRMQYNPGKIDLYGVILRSTNLYKMKASLKNITIENNVSENTFLFADKDMLVSIINNLLTNAIKFSYPESKIEIHSEVIEDHVLIRVKDYGVGMSENKMNELFRLDINPSTPGTSHEKGTGLGLILTREFIEKNKGTYKIDSVLGKGTEITVSIPISS